MSATTSYTSFSHSKNWEKNMQPFTDNELINAYQLGKKTGMTEHARILSRTLETNINKAKLISETLFSIFENKSFRVLSIHLRVDNISSFTALFVVDFAVYLSDAFREAFVIARECQQKENNEDFHISFLFMAYSQHIDQDSLNADGYFLKYEKRSIEA